MQLALTNVGQTTFGKAKDEEMVRETVSEEEAFSEKAVSNQQSAISERQNQHQNQNQRRFDAEDAQPPQQAKTGLAGDPGDAKENQGLPLMNTDGADFGAGGKDRGGDVEFVPMPGGYGFERVRLRIGDQHSAISLKQEPFTANDAKESKRPQTYADNVLLTESYANLG
jgi:hypothetical protein